MRAEILAIRLVAFPAALLASLACADVRLPRLVGDHMVLQRDSEVILWGWADPSEAVNITFQGQKVAARTNRHGRWQASLGPYPAGGPYDMTITGKNRLLLRDILVGDVWLASGQSNMEVSLEPRFGWKGVNDADREIAGANFPHIRLFVVEHNAALKPTDDVSTVGWRSVTPEHVAGFSAVAYFFGRELYGRYHIPIGLIQSTWGGTVAEAWTSEAGLQRFPEFHAAIATLTSEGTKKARADFDHYLQQKAAWYLKHGSKDRGRVAGHEVWADPKLDVSDWPTMSIPRPFDACGKDLNGFHGVVWFRRVIEVPPERAGQDLVLHLGQGVVARDLTYFNGQKIGGTLASDQSRDYWVPGEYVQSGENTIAMRIVGEDFVVSSCTGLFGPAEPMRAVVGSTVIPLAGTWSYRPGPDLRGLPVADTAMLAANPSPTSPRYTPTVLFNGMINPLAKFQIKGVIWYQGEENAIDDRSAQYRQLFPALIQDWRQHWGYAFPFLFVQLADTGSFQGKFGQHSWAELREAQQMALSVPGTGMASAVDLGDEGSPHPKNKQDVGRRLALVAAKLVYGEQLVCSGPTYESMEIQDHTIRVKFSNLGSGLMIKDKYGYARGFEIAAADGEYRRAQVRQDGNDVLVFNDTIQRPVSVRYDWSNRPDGNVYNKEGLPLTPFRSDSP